MASRKQQPDVTRFATRQSDRSRLAASHENVFDIQTWVLRVFCVVGCVASYGAGLMYAPVAATASEAENPSQLIDRWIN